LPRAGHQSMCQPWPGWTLSPQQLWGASLRPEGEGVGWLRTSSSPSSSPPVSPEAAQQQKHVQSQPQSAPWPLSPRQKLAKSLIASALVPAGSSGRQWLPSASSALVVKDRHVATPCKSVRKTSGDIGQYHTTGSVSPLHSWTATRTSDEEKHNLQGSSSPSNGFAAPFEIETGATATPCRNQGAWDFSEAASIIASALQWSSPEEPERARIGVPQQHTLSPYRSALQALSNEMFKGFEDIAQEDLAEWLADFDHLGKGVVQRSSMGKGCSRSSPDGHVASNVIWDAYGRNSVSSSAASTCVPASSQNLSDERRSSGHWAALRCNLDLSALAECQ